MTKCCNTFKEPHTVGASFLHGTTTWMSTVAYNKCMGMDLLLLCVSVSEGLGGESRCGGLERGRGASILRLRLFNVQVVTSRTNAALWVRRQPLLQLTTLPQTVCLGWSTNDFRHFKDRGPNGLWKEWLTLAGNECSSIECVCRQHSKEAASVKLW